MRRFHSGNSILKRVGGPALIACVLTAAAVVMRATPAVETPAAARGPAPDGMAWIAGGQFWMGSEEPQFRDARPVHPVRVDGFWIDRTEVTNEQFRKFVEASGHVTVAEKAPRAEDFPGAPPENLVAASVVFA